MKDILRSRLSDGLDPVARDFLSSLEDDLHRSNIITKIEAKKILGALLEILDDVRDGKFKINPEFEDIHPLIEAKVISRTGIDVGGKIHSGRSRNDQVAVDIRLKTRCLLLSLRGALLDLIKVLMVKAKQYREAIFPLYTHLQPAQIGTFGHYLLNHVSELLRHGERLEECYGRTNKSPLGACAIGGTSFPINRDITTKFLGFSGIVINSIDAVSSRDVLIENLSIISSIFACYSRIAEDLIIYSSREFNFIDLPEKYCSVSSVLPQKKNPDTLELIRGNAALAIAGLNAQLTIAKGTPTGYNRDFQECKPILWALYKKVIISTKLLAGIIKDLELLQENVRSLIETSYLQALDLAEHISLNHTIPFRKAHEFIAKLVQKLSSENISLKTASNSDSHRAEIKKLAHSILKSKDCIDDSFFRLMGDYNTFKLRKSLGSPAPKEFDKMMVEFERNREALFKKLLEDKTRVEESLNNLLNEIRALINEN
ncbi:MAG: argininosuccinate lyase [Promethearchaeota archaeon]